MMTDSILPPTSTESEQLVRVEELRRRRAGATTEPPRRQTARPHAASGSRIAAAGGGLAAMLGLVAVFGLIERSVAADPVQPVGTAQSQVVVVIHRGDPARPADSAGSAVAVAPASGPIALTARPTVTGAPPVAQTPAATTNGSR